jgi:hypothetical protein
VFLQQAILLLLVAAVLAVLVSMFFVGRQHQERKEVIQVHSV